MGHLKRGSDGHLVRNAAGHLAKCPDDSSPCACTGDQTVAVEVIASATIDGVLYTTGANCNCGTTTELDGTPHTMLAADFYEDAFECRWTATWPCTVGGGMSVIATHSKVTGLDRIVVSPSSGPLCTVVFDSGWKAGLLTCAGGTLSGTATMFGYNFWPPDADHLCVVRVTIG